MKRSLCILFLLLLLALPLYGCQAEEDTALIIEQGEIRVDSIWKNSYYEQNPCPNDVPGETVELQRLLYERVKVLRMSTDSAYELHRAGSIDEAAALLERAKLQSKKQLGELCEDISHLDFDQFFLVMLLGKYNNDIEPQGVFFDALVLDEAGNPTAIYQKRRDAEEGKGYAPTAYADFIVIRREAIPALANTTTMPLNHFICTRADVNLMQTEVRISDMWLDNTPAVNPCPEDVYGTALEFEQLCYRWDITYKAGRDRQANEMHALDDLPTAAAWIKENLTGYYSLAFEELCDAVSCIDFSQFRLLVFVENYGGGNISSWYRLDALVHNGHGALQRVFYRYELDSYMTTHDLVTEARLVLVRRSDYNIPASAMTYTDHYYSDPANVIEPGDILVSDFWADQPASGADNLTYETLTLTEVELRPSSYGDVATNLDEAAALIDGVTHYNSETCLALNEIASHVDFDQFYLIFIYESHRDGCIDQIGASRLTLNENGDFHLRLIDYHDEPVKHHYGSNDYVRLLLVRRTDVGDPPEDGLDVSYVPYVHWIEI